MRYWGDVYYDWQLSLKCNPLIDIDIVQCVSFDCLFLSLQTFKQPWIAETCGLYVLLSVK